MESIEYENSRIKRVEQLRPHPLKKYTIPLFILLLILNIFLSSCEDDTKGLNTYYGDYGVVHKSEESYFIKLDGGAAIYPSVAYFPSEYLKDKERVIVNFNLLAEADTTRPFDYYARILEISKILTKEILPYSEDIVDSLGYDPVVMNEVWVKNGFITMDFFFGAGQAGLIHMVNLVKHNELTDDGRILLEFCHNAFEDPYNYQYRGIVSFPVDGLRSVTDELEEEESEEIVKIKLLYQGFEGKKTINLTWHVRENSWSDVELKFGNQEYSVDTRID